RPPEDPVQAETLLKQYLGKDFALAHVPQGWFQWGGWHDVPKNACRRFHHHGTYYWIAPGMEEHLTKLTITILDIATIAPSKPSQTIVWKIDPKTNQPTEVQITRTLTYAGKETTKIPSTPIE